MRAPTMMPLHYYSLRRTTREHCDDDDDDLAADISIRHIYEKYNTTAAYDERENWDNSYASSWLATRQYLIV
jgi:hypothetical protein